MDIAALDQLQIVLDPVGQAGIVVACCPGGAVSNLLTYLARGNVVYSVSLTATSSVLAALLTPASILFWSHLYEPTSLLLEAIDVSPAVFHICVRNSRGGYLAHLAWT